MLRRSLLSTFSPSAIFSSSRASVHGIQETKQVINRFLEDPKKIKLRNLLQADPRYRISKNEYLTMASNVGLNEAAAKEFLDHLDKATVVMTLPQSEKYVFLKPDALSKHIVEVVDPKVTELNVTVANLQTLLAKEKEEHSHLLETKAQLDKRAERSASGVLTLGGIGLIGHFALVTRMTWWELSWDIVEPITYMITYTTSTAILLYFCINRVEYDYRSFFDRMVAKRQKKLYTKENFDLSRFQSLTSSIKETTEQLEALGQSLIPPHAGEVNLQSNEQHFIAPGEKAIHTA